MSWGNKLLLVFISFAGLMSYMTYRCMQTPVDLVTKEYYRDELAYQQVIDGTKKANALSGKVTLHHQSGQIIVQFPQEMKDSPIKGAILFYCPADATRDRRLSLELDADGKQSIDAKAFHSGRYVVKIEWESHQTTYYSELNFIIT